MASEYTAQLLAVETKLAKDPDNEELLQLKRDLVELIELSESLDEDESKLNPTPTASGGHTSGRRGADDGHSSASTTNHAPTSGTRSQQQSSSLDDGGPKDSQGGARRPLTEAELLAKKREKNKKKKAKLREKIKEQLDTAESEKQSWQSFASKKGLKGITKKSIFASPHSLTGKVGVGTNGISDAPSVGATTSFAALTKRKF